MTTIEPIRSDPPDAEAMPFPLPITFWEKTGEGDDGKPQLRELTEDFQCRPFVSAGVLIGLDAMYGRSANSTNGAAIFDIISAAMLPDALVRWREVLYQEHLFISTKAVNEVALKLYEVYTARPTQSPAGS